MEDFMCNVLIMGKTGTGKSSLLNYICGEPICEKGVGKPVTGEGIYESIVKFNNQDVRLFDSWGIEAGKVDRWKALITDALKKHGTQRSIQDWFHSIIYCIQAGGGRVEDIDVEIIKQFLDEGYKLTIVLTKADQVSEEDETIMKETIASEICGGGGDFYKKVNIIATCAEEKVTRSGTTKQFGKQEVCDAILMEWKDTIIERLPQHIIARIYDYIDKEVENIKSEACINVSGIESENTKIINDALSKIGQLADDINNNKLKEFLNEAAQQCHKANMAIKAMMGVQCYITPLEEKKKKKWIDAVLIGGSAIGLGLIGLSLYGIGKGIAKLIQKSRRENNDNVREQQQYICQKIEEGKQKLIEEYKNEETKIIEQIKSSIQNEV